MHIRRSSGILLHPTSLPGKFGIGSLGKEAFWFVDLLASSGQRLWQILPLGPTGYGDSPYQCFSAFAGNPLLIDLDLLVKDGLLDRKDLDASEKFDDKKVDYGKVIEFKYSLYRRAFLSGKSCKGGDFRTFCGKHSSWLEDYSLYMSLKEHFKGKPWQKWPRGIKFREPGSLEIYRKRLSGQMDFHKFLQYEFFKQWHSLRTYANSKGIRIIGDIPIFVAGDSSDAWAHPELFYFDERRAPTKVAGVPPDYFSATGQLWGNPLYNWSKMKKNGYRWWIQRISSVMETCDIIRLDHFRGFAGYWAVPSHRHDAIVGKWEKGPGLSLFRSARASLGELPIIAEDLGTITPDVEKLRDELGLPGMKILQFAFDPDNESIYIPHRLNRNSVVYTGTHDNDTTRGWYEKIGKREREYVNRYLDTDGKDIAWDMIRAAWLSKSMISIAPMQDLLSLGSSARMNTPGGNGANWQWRLRKKDVKKGVLKRLRQLTVSARR